MPTPDRLSNDLEDILWDLHREKPRRFDAVIEDFTDVIDYDGHELTVSRTAEDEDRILAATDAALQELADG